MCDNETEVGHCKRDEIDVYIGRKRDGSELKHLNNTDIGEDGWLGNPHPVDECESRNDSVERFEADIKKRVNEDAEFRNALADLKGATLGCWCRSVSEESPLCHGDVIRAWIRTLN